MHVPIILALSAHLFIAGADPERAPARPYPRPDHQPSRPDAAAQTAGTADASTDAAQAATDARRGDRGGCVGAARRACPARRRRAAGVAAPATGERSGDLTTGGGAADGALGESAAERRLVIESRGLCRTQAHTALDVCKPWTEVAPIQ